MRYDEEVGIDKLTKISIFNNNPAKLYFTGLLSKLNELLIQLIIS